MSLRIGLCGAHRTGKTTLAKALSGITSVPYIDASVRKTYEDRGVSVNGEVSLMDRLDIQYEILARYTDLLTGKNQFITDRTPIDFAAYTLNYLPNNAPEDVAMSYMDYVANCIEATTLFFDVLTLVQPGIESRDSESDFRGSANLGWQEKLNLSMSGLLYAPELRSIVRMIIPRERTDFEQRLSTLNKLVARSEVMLTRNLVIH